MRFSTGLVNKLADTLPLKDAIAGYVIDIYSGVQPVLPDNAPSSSTLLLTVTNNSQEYTNEVLATGTMTLTGGASGSVNTVTLAIGGGTAFDILGTAVAYQTDLPTTAALVAAQINRNPCNHFVTASASGAVITLTGLTGMGTLPNGWVIAATLTTITATYVAMGSVVAGVSAVNGLNYDMAIAGVISKLTTETWSGSGLAAGTAGWFRIRGQGDAGSTSSTTAVRIDGSIGTSGADMNVASLNIAVSAPFLVPQAALTFPQQ